MSRKGLSDVSLKALAYIVCKIPNQDFYSSDIPTGGNRGAIMSALVKRDLVAKVGAEYRPRKFKLTPHGLRHGNRYAEQYINLLKTGGQL